MTLLLLKLIFFIIKSESRHRVGTHVKNAGPQWETIISHFFKAFLCPKRQKFDKKLSHSPFHYTKFLFFLFLKLINWWYEIYFLKFSLHCNFEQGGWNFSLKWNIWKIRILCLIVEISLGCNVDLAQWHNWFDIIH